MARRGAAEASTSAGRRVRARDRSGVENIEGLPPSFEWRDQGASTMDGRASDAIVKALALQPGRTARVRTFRDPGRAERFADYLRTVAAVPLDMLLEVSSHGRDVYASLTPRGAVPEPAPVADGEAGEQA